MPLPLIFAGIGAGAATAGAGAAAGGGLTFLGGLGALTGLAGIAGSLGAFGGRRGVSVPDISAELSRISVLFAQARAAAVAAETRRGQQERGLLASNLAARGILRSPVSENVFGAQREQVGQRIAAVEGRIAGAEATAQAGILGQLLSARQRAETANIAQSQQRQQALFGGLGALGGALFRAGTQPTGVTVAGAAPAAAAPSVTAGITGFGAGAAGGIPGLAPTVGVSPATLSALNQLFNGRR